MRFYLMTLMVLVVVEYSCGNDSDEVVLQWQQIDKVVRGFSARFFGQMFPPNWFLSTNISVTCLKNMQEFHKGLVHSKAWAFKMLDSYGKIPSGYLERNLVSLGDYYECLDVNVATPFQSKYCLLKMEIPLPDKKRHLFPTLEVEELKNIIDPDSVVGEYLKQIRTNYYLKSITSVCIPSSCSNIDLQKMASKLIKSSQLPVKLHVMRCKTKHQKIAVNFSDKILMSILLMLFAVIILGTLLEVYKRYMYQDSTKSLGNMGKVSKYLLFFSVISNTESIFEEDKNPDSIRIFHGMRVITSFWVILFHTCTTFRIFLFDNILRTWQVVHTLWFQFIANGSLLVETFYFISAVLLTLNLMKKKNQDISIARILLRRYLRSYVPLFFLILCICLMGFLSSGPIYEEYIGWHIHLCKVNSWTTLLCVNNYIHPLLMCNPVTWYLAVDFQMLIVALLIIFPFRNKPKVFLTVLGICFVLSICGQLYSHIKYNLPPTNLNIYVPEDVLFILRKSYFLPHYHFPTYCIGLLVGYILATRKHFKLSKKLDVILWVISLLVMNLVLFGVYVWNRSMEQPSRVPSVLYGITFRWLWALGLAWITISSHYNKHSLVREFLGAKLFVPLSRLTFMVYLTHTSVMELYYATATQTITLDVRTWVIMFCAFVMISYILSFVLTLLFEIPFLRIVKELLDRSPSNNKDLLKEKMK